MLRPLRTLSACLVPMETGRLNRAYKSRFECGTCRILGRRGFAHAHATRQRRAHRRAGDITFAGFLWHRARRLFSEPHGHCTKVRRRGHGRVQYSRHSGRYRAGLCLQTVPLVRLYMGIWPGCVVILCVDGCKLTTVTTSGPAMSQQRPAVQVWWASRCLVSCCSAPEAQQSLQGGGMRLV